MRDFFANWTALIHLRWILDTADRQGFKQAGLQTLTSPCGVGIISKGVGVRL
jgi:hypothetical protein